MSGPTDFDLKALAAVLGLTLSALVWHRTAGTLAPILRDHGFGEDEVARFAPPPTPGPIKAKAKAPTRKPKPAPIPESELALEPLTPPAHRRNRPAPSAVWAAFPASATAH